MTGYKEHSGINAFINQSMAAAYTEQNNDNLKHL